MWRGSAAMSWEKDIDAREGRIFPPFDSKWVKARLSRERKRLANNCYFPAGGLCAQFAH